MVDLIVMYVEVIDGWWIGASRFSEGWLGNSGVCRYQCVESRLILFFVVVGFITQKHALSSREPRQILVRGLNWTGRSRQWKR